MAGTNRRSTPPARRSSRVAAKPRRTRKFFDYPRTGYHGLHRWLPSWRFLLGSLLAVVFLGLGVLFAIYRLTPIPDAASYVKEQLSTVYYADNEDGSRGDVMGTFAAQRREIVALDTLPAHVGDTVVAAEDRTFWSNSGISITGMGRAFLNNIRGGATQGGSTLTQQYVERYYSETTTTDYVGKAKEAILAVKISREQDKSEILENYLNTIYFGRDSYGIQVAAKSYFGVSAAELTVSQAALLAGIIPSPNNWDPAKAPDKAEQKWNTVLDRMVEDGTLDKAERDTLEFPATIEYARSDTMGGPNGYILDTVRKELVNAGFVTEDTINRTGLEIVTTIRKPVQEEAVRAVGGLLDGTLAAGVPDPAMKVGMVSISPKDGSIVAMYGGPDFITQSLNQVTQGSEQAGSTFKPFTLIAALESGISLDKTYSGKSPMKLEGWDSAKGVQNFGNEGFGHIDLVKATEQSVNTVYAQLNLEVGPEKSAEVARRAGVKSTLGSNPANVLGTDDVHPIDIASAYSTIAAQGYYSTPHVVKEVRHLNNPDEVAYTGGSAPTKQFEPDVMADTTYALQQVVQSGSGEKWVKPVGRPIAGKTGTSQENKSAWFVGFTPELTTAVAFSQGGGESGNDPVTITPFGTTNAKPNGRAVSEITGSTWPAALWASYMKPVLEMAPYNADTPFPPRAKGKAATPTATPSATEAPEPEPTQAAPTEIAVPGPLEGKREADAEAAVLNAGLTPSISKQPSATVEAGRVIKITPGTGEMMAPGGTVSIIVSSGPPTPTTPPPVPPVAPPVEPVPGQPTTVPVPGGGG